MSAAIEAGAEVAATPNQPAPPPSVFDGDRACRDTHSTNVAVAQGRGANQDTDTQGGCAPPPFPYHELRDLARTLDDLESTRIKIENRILSSVQHERLPAHHEAEMLEAIRRAEHCAVLDLQRLIRTHPLWNGFAKGVKGCGEKLFARLLAEIGDPATGSRGHWVKETLVREDETTFERRTWVVDEEFPRTVSQLWRYCGLDPTAKIKKGATAEEVLRSGKPGARKSLYLISTSMLKSGNRDVYDTRRQMTADREGWTKGRSHNDALRLTAKEFVKDLWRAAQ